MLPTQCLSASRIVIAAVTRAWIIGRGGRLPWHLPEDLKIFRQSTLGHTLVMGRKTFDSLGRPLPDRRNLVVSRTLAPQPGIEICRDFGAALKKAEAAGGKVFFIGGEQIYRQALPVAEAMILSWVRDHYRGDSRFPRFDGRTWRVVHARDHGRFLLACYRRRVPGSD